MDKSVRVTTPGGGAALSVTGSADDFGVIGAIERAGGAYEPQVMGFLARLVRPSDVCVDIGANIGVLTLLLSRLASEGQVFAFEPGDASFTYLQKNIADNGAANVVVEKLGVYDVTDTLTLQVEASHPGGAYLAKTDAHEVTSESVSVTRLDDWACAHALARIDVIKLDIEGAEVRALDGAHDVLTKFRPALIVECNPVALRRFQGLKAEDLITRLRSIYGSLFFLDGSVVRELSSIAHAQKALEAHGIIDLVCGDRVEALTAAPPPSNRVYRLPRRVRGAARSVRNHARPSEPPVNFVHAPSYEARFDVNRLVAQSGTTMTLPVSIHNTGDAWFSSTFPNHPVCASYRWRTPDGTVYERDGIRTFFRRPLGPGEATVVQLVVAMPATPGEYVLEFALVQEAFAWLDDLRPELTVRLPVAVR